MAALVGQVPADLMSTSFVFIYYWMFLFCLYSTEALVLFLIIDIFFHHAFIESLRVPTLGAR